MKQKKLGKSQHKNFHYEYIFQVSVWDKITINEQKM